MGVLNWGGLVAPKFSAPPSGETMRQTPNVLEVQERARGPLSPCQVVHYLCDKKKTKFRLAGPLLLLCGCTQNLPRPGPDNVLKSVPDFIQIGSLLAELYPNKCMNIVREHSKVNPILRWSVALSRIIIITRMWANTQRDGRPAEYRWHPLFNAAKFCWRPLLEYRAVTLPRCETHWN